MAEKVGVVFLAAAFLQADNGGETFGYLVFAVGALAASVFLSGAE